MIEGRILKAVTDEMTLSYTAAGRVVPTTLSVVAASLADAIDFKDEAMVHAGLVQRVGKRGECLVGLESRAVHWYFLHRSVRSNNLNLVVASHSLVLIVAVPYFMTLSAAMCVQFRC